MTSDTTPRPQGGDRPPFRLAAPHSLRFQVTLLLLGLGLPLLALLALGIPALMKSRLDVVERVQLGERALGAADALAREGRRISLFTLNFAAWSETYRYVLGQNPGYPAANLVPSSFQGGDVEYWGIRDLGGQILSAARFDGQRVRPAPDQLRALFQAPTRPAATTGIVWVRGVAHLVATRPVTKDGGAGPQVGTMLLASVLDPAHLAGVLRLRAGERAALSPPRGPAPGAAPTLSLGETSAHTRMAVFGPGRGAAVLTLSTPRELYGAMAESLRVLQLISVSALVICVLSLRHFLDRRVLRVLEGYSRDTQRVAWDRSHRLQDGDTTELGGLATTINGLLDHQARRTEELWRSAHVDPVTDCLTLSGLLEQAPSAGQAAFLVDLSQGRNLRALYGQATLDELLRQVAARLQALCAGQAVAHLHPGEFAVVFGSPLGAETAAALYGALTQPYELNRGAVTLEFTAGWVGSAGGQDTATLLTWAGLAAQYARETGRPLAPYDRHVFVAFQRQHDLRRHLQGAETRGEFTLVFQPVCALKGACGPPGQTWTALEALMRWHSPELGPVSPAEFIPVAERSALIYALGEWALREALLAARRAQASRPGLRVSVNVSPLQLLDPDYADSVLRLVAQLQADPRQLILEVTESTLMQNPALVAQHLGRLRAAGVWIALDDFGTGHSSLSLLTQVPLDLIKLDRSFLSQLGGPADPSGPPAEEQGARQAAGVLLQATLQMIHALGFRSVVEGIETAETLELLRRLDCHAAQGYFLARPQPLDQLLP